MSQKHDVLAVFTIPTLSHLYASVGMSNWQSKRPFTSIRLIEFFKFNSGLWAFGTQKDEILALKAS